jgi:hypothetical protein
MRAHMTPSSAREDISGDANIRGACGSVCSATFVWVPQSERLLWCAIVEEYSRRVLSVPSDKLSSLSGIARRIAAMRTEAR